MISKKDKYRLRALANPLKPLVIIGKDGFNESIIQAINDAIKTNELIKISTLKTYKGMPIKELGMLIASTIDGEFIFSIGNICVIYKKNKDINRYEVK